MPRKRQAISDSYLSSADAILRNAMTREAQMHCPRFTLPQILDMLFPDDVVQILTTAAPYCHHYTITSHYYRFPQGPSGSYVRIEFGNRALIPAEQYVSFGDKAQPLLDVIKTLQDIQLKYGKVNYLLHWFAQNATLGATMATWPAVAQLCPALCRNRPTSTRYTYPEGLSSRLDLVRETETTVALMSMLPQLQNNADPSIVSVTLAGHNWHGTHHLLPIEAVSFNL